MKQLIPSSNSSNALARRAKRCAAEPSRVSSIRSCHDSLSRKPARITRSAESRSHALASDSFGFPQSCGINHRLSSQAGLSHLEVYPPVQRIGGIVRTCTDQIGTRTQTNGC